MKQQGVNRVVMAVRDLEAGRAFYEELLGCTFHSANDEEASAFGVLSELVCHVLPRYHAPDMAGLHAAQAHVLTLVRHAAPALARRLSAAGVPVKEQTTSWLLCAFVDALRLDATLRVWDLLFLDGERVLLCAAAALFALHERRLLPRPEEELYDLRALLACEPHELLAAARQPGLQKAAAAAMDGAMPVG